MGTIVQVGPGEGVFDQPELQELLQRCPGIDLPLPLLPGSPVTLGRPAGAPLRSLTLDPATPGLLLSPPNLAGGLAAFAPAMGDLAAARLAARQRLGLPEDGFLACQMADLVAGERPEDLVELAWRCPEIRFLQVGRGGLAGRRDDLRRFRGATNLRCLPAAELADVLAAADVMLALGEPSLWPWPIFGALAAGVPVVGRPLGALAPYANYLLVASSLAEMVERLAAQRRDGDPPGRRPRPPAAAGAATLAELLGS